jgi:hypothetical protein
MFWIPNSLHSEVVMLAIALMPVFWRVMGSVGRFMLEFGRGGMLWT